MYLSVQCRAVDLLSPHLSVSAFVFKWTALNYDYSKPSWLRVKGGYRLRPGWDSFVKQNVEEF